MIRTLIFSVLVLGAVGFLHSQEPQADLTDYPAVADAINETMRAHHYNPAELDSVDYGRIEAAVSTLAKSVTSDDEFVTGFNNTWKEGPFSHVKLQRAKQSADEMAAYLDSLRIGGGGAVLTWAGGTAILTVNTMMGADTIEEIDAAYVAITDRAADTLIIDLRENGGGTFAVRPLVEHLLSDTVDAGSFVSQRWNAAHSRPPDRTELEAVAPWQGWSIRSFWSNVQDAEITRISFEPAEPVYSGPVYVLTSKRTASAAELTVDALKGSGRAIVIGEQTAGKMLSEKIYDVLGGFHLSLPIADYFSAHIGRIEGVGIAPNIATDAADALSTALGQ